jgi:hypothetical protein
MRLKLAGLPIAVLAALLGGLLVGGTTLTPQQTLFALVHPHAGDIATIVWQ